jgi:general secretion pathway protein J
MTVLCHNHRRTRGFTLIEVLLAVVVFAIVLASIHTVFYGAMRLRNKTTAMLEESLPIQQTLAVMKRDLANLVMPGETIFGQLQTTSTNSSLQSLASSSASTFSGGGMIGQASPEFCTSVGIIDDYSPWAEVEKVRYYLAESTNNTAGKDLIRSVTRNLLPTMQEQPVDQWMMSGVQRIFFYYYDGNQWQDAWDSTAVETNKLPLAIKVEIQLTAQETERWQRAPIELVVPVMVQQTTNQTTQTTETAQTTGGQE